MGTHFSEAYDSSGDQRHPYFTARTTRPVVLPPKPGCVVAPATIETKEGNFTLTTKYPPMPSDLNVPGLTVQGKVATNFR